MALLTPGAVKFMLNSAYNGERGPFGLNHVARDTTVTHNGKTARSSPVYLLVVKTPLTTLTTTTIAQTIDSQEETFCRLVRARTCHRSTHQGNRHRSRLPILASCFRIYQQKLHLSAVRSFDLIHTCPRHTDISKSQLLSIREVSAGILASTNGLWREMWNAPARHDPCMLDVRDIGLQSLIMYPWVPLPRRMY